MVTPSLIEMMMTIWSRLTTPRRKNGSFTTKVVNLIKEIKRMAEMEMMTPRSRSLFRD